MTEDRTQAYTRVVKALDELGPSKLQPHEQAVIRDAADALIFCGAAELDVAGQRSLQGVEALFDALVLSGRWTEPTAQSLLVDIAGCGPRESIALLAA